MAGHYPGSIRAAGPETRHWDAPPGGDRLIGENPPGLPARYVHELFGERVSRRPDADAVISAAGRLTYRQLDDSVNRPKAVAVSHGSLACVIRQFSRQYQISPGDRVLQLASLGFDTSPEQILVTPLCGATLMLPPAGPVATG